MTIVKMTSRASASGASSSSLNVPKLIADALRSAKIETFTVEVTEDGILYRPTKLVEPETELPSWLQNGASTATPAAPAKPSK